MFCFFAVVVVLLSLRGRFFFLFLLSLRGGAFLFCCRCGGRVFFFCCRCGGAFVLLSLRGSRFFFFLLSLRGARFFFAVVAGALFFAVVAGTGVHSLTGFLGPRSDNKNQHKATTAKKHGFRVQDGLGFRPRLELRSSEMTAATRTTAIIAVVESDGRYCPSIPTIVKHTHTSICNLCNRCDLLHSHFCHCYCCRCYLSCCCNERCGKLNAVTSMCICIGMYVHTYASIHCPYT